MKLIKSFQMLFACIFMLFIYENLAATDSISQDQSIRDGDTLVSAGGAFEVGFFSPGNSKNRYLGIWYKNVSPTTVVWVANREAPLINRFGVLNVTHEGTLVLLDERNSRVWSSNKLRTARNPVLQLLDSGNLVVKDRNDINLENALWQSFDYPCDTLLPGMKLGNNFVNGQVRSLSTWKSPNNPSPGQFSASIDPQGIPQLVVKKGHVMHFRVGSWNGLRFTGSPELQGVSLFKFEFQLTKNEVYYEWEFQNPQSSLISRLVVNQSGFLQRFARATRSLGWTLIYAAPLDQCDHYAVCGAYATCKIFNSLAVCACLDGFEPKSPKEWRVSNWSSGCVRKSKLDCRKDVFQKYTGFKLPDTLYSQYTNVSIECRETCFRDCSCIAYANSDVRNGGSGCLLWFNELIDMRGYTEGGQDLYVRKAKPESGYGKKQVAIIVSSVMLTGMVFIALLCYIWIKKLGKQGGGEDEEMDLPIFDLATIVKATDNFSSDNKLGQGGFGPVYKGTLAEGQEIAVKRLSKSSGQGMVEFKNEVILIAKLQHRNLVKLLGCCIQGNEKMLIYEYMTNKSLDYFIFDQTKKTLIDWQRRMHIIFGIARGLLYLHQDSRLRIIHRDLKVGNVLLDKDMNPKISDFGLARMFQGDQIEANTNRVVGTYGYMSPEYAVDGHFSIKSDVFSFGVIVLEIISGKKNRGFRHSDHNHNLLGHVNWRLWMEERALEVMDTMLEDRPDMSSVVLMLGSENPLPQPKLPGFYTERNLLEEKASSSQHERVSNEVTISTLQGR
ncbi:hypothetical protein SLA2020_121980 [Shorea laevis]